MLRIPDDLRRLVDRAHAFGLAVFLDVVYNHLGPDGAYAYAFSPYYFTDRHSSPWGAGVNLDGPHAERVREFFIENALHWTHEYHIDGLRLDATHAMTDESPRPFLAELAARVKAPVSERPVWVIAEDHRNLASMLKPPVEGGLGLDGVWADDFHHQMRRLLAGDHEGYYADFAGTVPDLVETIRRGWFFIGQYSSHMGVPRGTDPGGLPLERFVVCVQNHDQVGNRAFGERLSSQVEPAAFRAATAVLLTVPETPLIFMGQEWAASAPFLYFTDHHAELGRLVSEGRRREFGRFSAFNDPAVRDQIPDPQAESTFLQSRLVWAERGDEPHASMLRYHQALLGLRRPEPALRGGAPRAVQAIDDHTVVLYAGAPPRELLVVARLRGRGVSRVPPSGLAPGASGAPWALVITSEDESLCPDPAPIAIEGTPEALDVRFQRPGAVILRRRLGV